MADKKSTVTVQQTGSPLRRRSDQRATLIGLGLNKNEPPQDAGRYSSHSWHDPQSLAHGARC